MSRRSRRRNGGRPRGWAGRIALGCCGLFILGLGAGYFTLRNYLHGDGFRKFLSAEVSRAAKVKGEFSPFRWDGMAVDSADFTATSDGPVTALRIADLHTEVGFGGVRRGVWELKDSSAKRVDLTIDATARPPAETDAEPEISKNKIGRPRPWYPSEVEASHVDIREVNVRAILKSGEFFSVSGLGVKVDAGKSKGGYQAETLGGRANLPGDFLPEVLLDRMKLRFQDDRLFVTSATGSVWEGGRIDLSGEWDLKAKHYAFEGAAKEIACENLLSANWAKRVSGVVSSDFTVESIAGEPQAHGRLAGENIVLTALPVLDALAAYADTRRFRSLALTEFSADWQWQKGETKLTRVILASEGLVRLEGDLTIRGRNLSGIFRLGLAPGTLKSIPGGETDVFVAGERGLLWTSLGISGSIDDPKEDLTDRLIAAAGVRMFEEFPESGAKVLKFSRSLLGENPDEAIRKGIDAIEKTEGAVREARELLRGSDGLLESLLGGRKSKEERKRER